MDRITESFLQEFVEDHGLGRVDTHLSQRTMAAMVTTAR
jgi:hypothetical protein